MKTFAYVECCEVICTDIVWYSVAVATAIFCFSRSHVSAKNTFSRKFILDSNAHYVHYFVGAFGLVHDSDSLVSFLLHFIYAEFDKKVIQCC